MTYPAGVARYAHLAAVMRRRIESGELEPGARLPSEQYLADEMGVSRITMRRAMGILRSEGLLEVRNGVGTWVRSAPPEPSGPVVPVQRGATWVVRMPTPSERAEHDIADGVPVLVLQYGLKTTVYPGDRHRFTAR